MALPTKTATGSLRSVGDALPNLLSRIGYRQSEPKAEALATAAATILYGSYRRDDAADVEVLMSAAIAVLAEYPPECIRHVTDPRTGIQSNTYVSIDPRTKQEVRGRFQSFPPNPGELQEACEAYMAPIRRREYRERQEREQAERTAKACAEEAARRNRPTLAELQAKYGMGGDIRVINERGDVIAGLIAFAERPATTSQR